MTEETFAQGILVGLWGASMIFSFIWYILVAISNYILFKKRAMQVGSLSFQSITSISNNASHLAKAKAGLSSSYSFQLLDRSIASISPIATVKHSVCQIFKPSSTYCLHHCSTSTSPSMTEAVTKVHRNSLSTNVKRSPSSAQKRGFFTCLKNI